MTQAETACPDVWGSHFLEYRGRLLALARRNLNPVLARRVSAEDVVQEALLAACGKMAFFENNPEIPVYFKLPDDSVPDPYGYGKEASECLKRDACREVNVTDDSVGCRCPVGLEPVCRYCDRASYPCRQGGSLYIAPESGRGAARKRSADS